MISTKYIGMDVHKESISIAVRNATGRIVMECVIETKTNTILQFFDGLRGDVQVTFEEGTWAACPATEHMARPVKTDLAHFRGLRSKDNSSRRGRVFS